MLDSNYFFSVRTSSGEFKLSEACDHEEAFLQLTDDFLIRSLQFSCIPELRGARTIISNIIKRNLYKSVGVIEASGDAKLELDETKEELKQISQDMELDEDEMTILRKRVNMGMGQKNPVEKMLFYGKNGKTKTFTSDHLRKGLPREFSSETYFVVSKRCDQLEKARQCFKALSESMKKHDMNLSILD